MSTRFENIRLHYELIRRFCLAAGSPLALGLIREDHEQLSKQNVRTL